MPIIEGGGATPGAGVLPGSRRARISDYVAAAGEASVIELAASFGVSADTVRRDLVRLEQGGLLARTHGGAVALRTPAAELAPLAERQVDRLAAKRMIGRAAARLIQPGETVLINGGSTTLEVARALGGRPDVALVTCSPQVAIEAGGALRGVHLIGGRWHADFGVVIGPVALPGAERLRVDRLVLGVAGVAADGISIANIEEAAMLRGMIDAAEVVVVVADAAKLGRSAFARLAGLDRVAILVTDRTPDAELADALGGAGVEVVVAG